MLFAPQKFLPSKKQIFHSDYLFVWLIKLFHCINNLCQISPPPRAPSVLQKGKSTYTYWFTLVEKIPKIHRYSLGGKVEGYFLELLECIFTALYLPITHKSKRIETAISKLDGVKFFAQICWENKCIANAHYAELSAKLDELGKILGGWKKGLEKKTPEHIGRK